MAAKREPDRPTKLFTPESANATLPLVKAVVADAMSKWHELARLRELLSGHDEVAEAEEGESAAAKARRKKAAAKKTPLDERARRAAAEDARRLEEEIGACLKELEQIGASPKSLDTGLVDFPMRLKGGKIVELCWRAGEDRIGHWHDIGAGFPGRRPISELPAS